MDKKDAIKRYIAGEKLKDIARDFGVAESTIKSWANKHGYYRKKRAIDFTKEERTSVCKDYQSGMTLSEIAKKYGISTTTVRDWAKQRGLYIDKRIKHQISVFIHEETKPKMKNLEFIRTGPGAGYWGYKHC
ncbi:helix-turn-helix domain-containing protein [Anaerostipes faecalis]|uniref:helix-turn-helix domain-containing protein n=1 Tax=Anaerostipes faecalis TaxID=2738446 RepID=UPI001C1E6A41|nr:helix-turn-helix domain-containing protein [Anaerostipes faecalis]